MAANALPVRRVRLTRAEAADLQMLLGEGLHTGFRKGSSHEQANRAWHAIKALPPKDWESVLDFVMFGVQPYLERTVLPRVLARRRNDRHTKPASKPTQ